jgi:hypothetical protein
VSERLRRQLADIDRAGAGMDRRLGLPLEL